jgi:hypothetical protein
MRLIFTKRKHFTSRFNINCGGKYISVNGMAGLMFCSDARAKIGVPLVLESFTLDVRTKNPKRAGYKKIVPNKFADPFGGIVGSMYCAMSELGIDANLPMWVKVV